VEESGSKLEKTA